MRRPVIAAAIILTLSGVLLAAAPAQAGLARFDDPEPVTSLDGYLTLRWAIADESAARPGLFQVSVRTIETGEEELVYEGDGVQKFFSGLLDGDYEYRVRYRAEGAADWGEWSAPKQVKISHHNYVFAFSLFAVGGVLFVLTVSFIVRHERQDARERARAGSV